jgi:hypothetical protein
MAAQSNFVLPGTIYTHTIHGSWNAGFWNCVLTNFSSTPFTQSTFRTYVSHFSSDQSGAINAPVTGYDSGNGEPIAGLYYWGSGSTCYWRLEGSIGMGSIEWSNVAISDTVVQMG